MRIIGHGVDLVEVARFSELLDRHAERFVQRIFTEGEATHAVGSRRRAEHLAARFAAKEAVLKALGTGWSDGVLWTEIEVVKLPSGQPMLRLSGHAESLAARQGVREWKISMTHTDTLAMASVISIGD